MVIGIISDTHGWLDEAALKHFGEVDAIWHAGDIGSLAVADALAAVKPLKAVYGNIDGQEIRSAFPAELLFEVQGLKVLMTHIGGLPGRYPASIQQLMEKHKPDIFVCGHSHILKVTRSGKMLHINPGAAGKHGFHQVRTVVLMTLSGGKIQHLDVVELGPRTELSTSRSSDTVS